jgi:hypothetical protein
LANEGRLNIRKPDMIGPAIAADRDRMAAMIIRAVREQAANAHFAHFTQRYFLLACHLTSRKPRLAFIRSTAATSSGRSSTVISRWIVPEAWRSGAGFEVFGQNTLCLFQSLNDQIAISLHGNSP